MWALRVLLVIFALQSGFASAETNDAVRVVVASDFSELQLVNLTDRQQHELLLKTFLQKNLFTVAHAFVVELITKSVGNDFYGFSAEDSANPENNAVAKATFECFTKLLYQDTIFQVISSAVVSGIRYARETDSISKGFSHMCFKINESLKNETCYSVAKEEFEKQNQTSPKKTYHYGIPKSDDDTRKIFAELSNDSQMKKLRTHLTYVSFNTPKEVVVSKSILELAKLPGKLQLVQKIYENSIDAVTLQVKDSSPAEIDLNFPFNFKMNNLKPILSETLLSKINENSDLKDDFEPIHKRNRQDILYEALPPQP